jgi:hypothetical protein
VEGRFGSASNPSDEGAKGRSRVLNCCSAGRSGARLRSPSDCYPEPRAVLRTISSSVLSLLVTVTLFWGGCISCPQFFMFPTEKADKSCCNKAGKCERPDKTAPENECKRMPLELQPFPSGHAELATAVVTTDILPLASLSRAPSPGAHFDTAAVEHSPPDLIVLHSKFLI